MPAAVSTSSSMKKLPVVARLSWVKICQAASAIMSAVDDVLRHPDDQSSIGIILCKSKNAIIAEYALRDTTKPIGISGYRAMESLPPNLKNNLPTIEDLEAELKNDKSRK